LHIGDRGTAVFYPGSRKGKGIDPTSRRKPLDLGRMSGRGVGRRASVRGCGDAFGVPVSARHLREGRWGPAWPVTRGPNICVQTREIGSGTRKVQESGGFSGFFMKLPRAASKGGAVLGGPGGPSFDRQQASPSAGCLGNRGVHREARNAGGTPFPAGPNGALFHRRGRGNRPQTQTFLPTIALFG